MYAQLRGKNQGLVKLIGNGIPKDKKAGKINVIKKTKLSLLLDGGRNFGIVAENYAIDKLLDIVSKTAASRQRSTALAVGE